MGHGDGQASTEAVFVLGGDQSVAASRPTSLLRAGKRNSPASQVRPARGTPVPEVLRPNDGTPIVGAGGVFSLLFAGLFRGDRFRARDCVSDLGFPEFARVPRVEPGRTDARSFDAVQDAAVAELGHTRSGVSLGARAAGGRRTAEWEDAGRRCHDAGSQRGVAEYRAARRWGGLRRTCDGVDEERRSGRADGRRAATLRPEATPRA